MIKERIVLIQGISRLGGLSSSSPLSSALSACFLSPSSSSIIRAAISSIACSTSAAAAAPTSSSLLLQPNRPYSKYRNNYLLTNSQSKSSLSLLSPLLSSLSSLSLLSPSSRRPYCDSPSSSPIKPVAGNRQSLGDQRTLYHQVASSKMKSGRDYRFDDRGGYRSNGASYGGGFGYGRSAGGFGGPRGGGRDGIAGRGLREIDWQTQELRPIEKNYYQESPIVSQRSQEDVDKWLLDNQVTIQGLNVPRAIYEFNETGFPDVLVDLLYSNFDRPTIIQSISWPIALSGRDIVSIAKTGSGKTLAFIIPGIIHTSRQVPRTRGEGPIVLVMLPTRELAQQVQEVSKEYCKAMNLTVTCLFGGAPKGGQARDLERGVDIVIATPGRLLDFLQTGATNLRRCSYLVLDEADRMLDMGFEPQIRKIVSQIRPDRQTLMFSATWPKEVRTLASDFQTNHAFLNVGSMELAANHNITQVVEVLEEYQKQPRMISLLSDIMNQPECKTLIFVETKRKADDLTRSMRRDGWPTLCIHGDKNQGERDWVLSEFKSGKTPILLATDVAARGLDVDDIKFVINYDYPNNSEDYVHRIGRTARCEKTGTAYTFFTPNNAAKARDLIRVMREANQYVPAELVDLAQRGAAANNSRSVSKSRYGTKRSYDDRDGGVSKRARYDGGGSLGGASTNSSYSSYSSAGNRDRW